MSGKPPVPPVPKTLVEEEPATVRGAELSSRAQERRSILPPVGRATSLDETSFEERYEMRRVLGEGGMGEVRLCRDARIGREVALKMIRSGLSKRVDFRSRFLREARVQGGLEHPSIVPVYDLGVAPDGEAYFTMKRIRGMTLAEVLESLRAKDKHALRQYSRRKLLAAFGSACLAVEFAHAHSVLHRDLKPSNIMLGTFGEVYVLDWGVAKIMAEDTASRQFDSGTDVSLTGAGALIGTLGYMSPEQFTDGDLDGRTDVYALGAILFEILTLQCLHDGTLPEIATSTVNGADARASARAPDREVAPELERICMKATATDPARRFASPRDLHDALERYLDGDRDMELRRDLASGHALAATQAAERARSNAKNPAAERAVAMREAGKALALDPTNVLAMGTMSRLLLEPPSQVPPEAHASLERAKQNTIRLSARMGIVAYGIWFLWLPFLFVMGIRSWAWVGATTLFFLLAALMNRVQLRLPSGTRSYGTAVVSMLAFICMSRLFGPEILVPTAALALAVTFGFYPYKGPRRLALACACGSMVIPLILEWAGVLPPSYLFANGTVVVLPQMVSLPKLPAMIALILFHTMLIISMWRLTSRVRDALITAEEKLAVQAWHLRQIVPHTLATSGSEHSSASFASSRTPA